MNEDRINYGDVHYAPDGTKLIATQPETDNCGCRVCDGCYYLNRKDVKCPRCHGQMVWIDYDWRVIWQTEEQIREYNEYKERCRRNSDTHYEDQTNYW